MFTQEETIQEDIQLDRDSEFRSQEGSFAEQAGPWTWRLESAAFPCEGQKKYTGKTTYRANMILTTKVQESSLGDREACRGPFALLHCAFGPLLNA